MQPLKVKPSTERPTPGDFHAHVTDGILYLPKDLADTAQSIGVRTAEDLLSYVTSYPSSIASVLHWSLEDVAKGTALLQSQLKGYVDPIHLNPPTRKELPMGARAPIRPRRG